MDGADGVSIASMNTMGPRSLDYLIHCDFNGNNSANLVLCSGIVLLAELHDVDSLHSHMQALCQCHSPEVPITAKLTNQIFLLLVNVPQKRRKHVPWYSSAYQWS